jgi:hypothetical protein
VLGLGTRFSGQPQRLGVRRRRSCLAVSHRVAGVRGSESGLLAWSSTFRKPAVWTHSIGRGFNMKKKKKMTLWLP